MVTTPVTGSRWGMPGRATTTTGPLAESDLRRKECRAGELADAGAVESRVEVGEVGRRVQVAAVEGGCRRLGSQHGVGFGHAAVRGGAGDSAGFPCNRGGRK